MKKFLFFSLAIFSLIGCKSTKSEKQVQGIIGTEWHLSVMNTKIAQAGAFKNGMPTITFSPDNKVSGTGGCNGYRGSYTLNDSGELSIDKVISTKMFCEGVNEGEFMEALSRVDRALSENGLLILSEGENQLLVFATEAGGIR